jgi:hypothetical protein
MAGLEADTSSYNQPMPVSPLAVAKDIAGMQQQKQQIESGGLAINQQKLDQANQGLTYMTRAMGALGPNAPKEAYIKAAEDAVKLGLVPPQAVQVFADKANAAPNSKAFYDEFMTTAADHQQQINYHIGQNKTVTDNKNITQGVEAPASQGGGFRPATRMPIQIAPGTAGYDKNNQQVFEQPEGPSGVVPAGPPVARPAPAARAMPVQPLQPPVTGPTGPTVETTGGPSSPPATFAQRTDAAFPNKREPLTAGPSPLFPEGKEAYTRDQLSASARSQAIKPAIQALKLMPGLSTGPGTGQFNDLVAAAKAWGVIDTKAENDPTVLRQELEKKLAQYVGSSPIGQRSDAAQTLAEAGSPNPKKQILPALQALTRDAIALDRVNILKPQAFKGSDYQNYIKHQGTFPQNIDEKALTLDMLPEKERNTLVTRMATQYKNGDAGQKKTAEKFLETLKLAKEHGIYEGM